MTTGRWEKKKKNSCSVFLMGLFGFFFLYFFIVILQCIKRRRSTGCFSTIIFYNVTQQHCATRLTFTVHLLIFNVPQQQVQKCNHMDHVVYGKKKISTSVDRAIQWKKKFIHFIRNNLFTREKKSTIILTHLVIFFELNIV